MEGTRIRAHRFTPHILVPTMKRLSRVFGASLASALLAISPPALLAQTPASGVATGRIVGRVVDDGSGQGLAGVGVQVVGTTIGAQSGLDGRFTIGRVPAGVISIQARRIGFAPKTVTGVVVPVSGVIEQDIALGIVAGQQPSFPPALVTAPDTAPPAANRPPPIDFSGVMFANFQYRLDRGSSRATNKFDVERVYLNFRMPAGDRASIRITTDLFQQQSSGSDAFYRGWVLRAKYAYLQYDYLKRGGLTAVARLGLVHNVFIDYDESFWPRWIGTVAADRHGYFSSSDAGLVTLVTLPGKRGELYATLVNGPGYTSRETDRFKDYAARLTLTPFAASRSGLWRTLALTGWTYQGAHGSQFASGGTGQVGPIGSSLVRDRWGVFAGIKDPRLTLAAQYARRDDEGESGANTPASPRSVIDSSGSLVSAYAMARIFREGGKVARQLHVLARMDRVTTHRARGDRHHLVVGGLVWDFTRAASLSLDYQELLPERGSAVAPNKTIFLHMVARF